VRCRPVTCRLFTVPVYQCIDGDGGLSHARAQGRT
jgi:hypothetical protein